MPAGSTHQLAKANFEPIDMGDMIEQLLETRESRGADGTVRIAFARPRKGITVILGEDIRIERVLTNLLDNAVSFSPPDGVVEISATRSEDEVIIRISDQGPGIPPNERETVFAVSIAPVLKARALANIAASVLPLRERLSKVIMAASASMIATMACRALVSVSVCPVPQSAEPVQ